MKERDGNMILGALLAMSLAAPAQAKPGGGAPLLAEGVSMPPAAAARALSRHALHLLDGRDASLAGMAGQVVVFNFWATWCRPCLRELPALQQLNTEIVPRGGRVLAVSIDQDRRNVERFAHAHALTLPVAHDGPDGLARELDLKQVPLTLVLDRSGAVAYCSSRTDAAGLAETRAAVLRLLAAPATPAPLAGESAGETP